MAKKLTLIDLSVPIEDCASELIRPEIEHEDHKKGADAMSAIFGIKKDASAGWTRPVAIIEK